MTEVSVIVKKAEVEDLEPLISNIRNADKIELEAATGRPYDEVVRKAFDAGMGDAWTGFADGKVGVMFGIRKTTILGSSGIPWLISTELVSKHRKEFIKHSKEVFDLIKGGYDHLYNYVDKRNVRAIKWLRWLGFTMTELAPYGVNGELFYRFEMRESDAKD